MEKNEVLEKVKEKKVVVGEMEKAKTNKSCWLGNIVACIVAVAFIVVESALGNRASAFAIAAVCFSWASVFYFCQYFVAKRPWPILIGAILEGLGALIMITNFVLATIGVI